MIRRRDFITLIGGAAAWPLAAHAQRPAIPVIGFLNTQSPTGYADRLDGFRQGLKEIGFVEGENVTIEYRWAQGKLERLPALAAELVDRKVAVLAALATPNSVAVAKAATTTIPVVFLVGDDPVRLGLVKSLARPTGNITGVNLFNNEITTKQLNLLRELVPTATRVAVLVNPTSGNAERTARDAEAAARAMGVRVQVHKASSVGEIDAAFAAVADSKPDAVCVTGDALFNTRRIQLVQLASYHHLPTGYPSRAYPDVGGLMSYGANVTEAYRQAGVYVGRILRGAKPSDLPVIQASKFELVINQQNAKMLGLTVPDRLLAIADEIIE
ncbi:MAG TPA: ABC transporter substrate-binding protein [Xanthobacteraceae bacterium]|jgi:putative ABC transport system substrate-binding protein